MNREAKLSTPHFHIRWDSGALDWEQHATRAEAEESAKQVAHPDDGYTVEEDDDARGCKAARQKSDGR